MLLQRKVRRITFVVHCWGPQVADKMCERYIVSASGLEKRWKTRTHAYSLYTPYYPDYPDYPCYPITPTIPTPPITPAAPY